MSPILIILIGVGADSLYELCFARKQVVLCDSSDFLMCDDPMRYDWKM